MAKQISEYFDLPVVQSHLRDSAAYVGVKASTRFIEASSQVVRMSRGAQFDSPLEVLFWLWWSACEFGNDFYPYNVLNLTSQVEVVAGDAERYRLDFVIGILEPKWQKALTAGAMTWPKIAVEVDGHAFHERTPEQVATRDRRDRALQQAGWLVFHYSWSEFTSRPQRCVEEVYNLATSAVVDLHRQYFTEIPAELRDE